MLQTRSSGSVRILSVDRIALVEKLHTISKTIKKDFPAVGRILLFGSFAGIDYTPESDVDILVIMRSTDVPFLNRRDAFEKYFRSIPFDVNTVVYTVKEIERLTAEHNTFIGEVLEHSMEL